VGIPPVDKEEDGYAAAVEDGGTTAANVEVGTPTDLG